MGSRGKAPGLARPPKSPDNFEEGPIRADREEPRRGVSELPQPAAPDHAPPAQAARLAGPGRAALAQAGLEPSWSTRRAASRPRASARRSGRAAGQESGCFHLEETFPRTWKPSDNTSWPVTRRALSLHLIRACAGPARVLGRHAGRAALRTASSPGTPWSQATPR